MNATVPLANQKLVKITDATRKTLQNSNTITPSDPSLIQAGMIVKHDKFGLGEVLTVEGSAPNTKAKVLFEAAGEKQLLLKFAKLEIVQEN